MNHTTHTLAQLHAAVDAIDTEATKLRAVDGESFTLEGRDVTASGVVDHGSCLHDLASERSRLAYEITCSEAMARSSWSLGDEVKVGSQWRMGPVEGDGGVWYRDELTGQHGRVLRFTPDGDAGDIQIWPTGDYKYDYVPACRLLRV